MKTKDFRKKLEERGWINFWYQSPDIFYAGSGYYGTSKTLNFLTLEKDDEGNQYLGGIFIGSLWLEFHEKPVVKGFCEFGEEVELSEREFEGLFWRSIENERI